MTARTCRGKGCKWPVSINEDYCDECSGDASGAVERVTPEVVEPITEAEARAATDMARRGAEDLWNGLARIVQTRGWVALGYPSFRQWAATELDLKHTEADRYLKKTGMLIEMAQETGMAPAALASRVPLRSMNRKPSKETALTRSMRSHVRKLAATPILTTPDERAAARELRDHLTRLIGD